MPIELNGSWMPYTNANITSLTDLLNYGNYATNNLFGSVALLILFAICIIAQRNRPMRDTLPVSSFICFIMSLLMRITGLVGNEMVAIFIALTAISMVLSFQD